MLTESSAWWLVKYKNSKTTSLPDKWLYVECLLHTQYLHLSSLLSLLIILSVALTYQVEQVIYQSEGCWFNLWLFQSACNTELLWMQLSLHECRIAGSVCLNEACSVKSLSRLEKHYRRTSQFNIFLLYFVQLFLLPYTWQELMHCYHTESVIYIYFKTSRIRLHRLIKISVIACLTLSTVLFCSQPSWWRFRAEIENVVIVNQR